MKKRLNKEQRTRLRAAYEIYHAACSAATVAHYTSDDAMRDYIRGERSAVPVRLIRATRARMTELKTERARMDKLLAEFNA